MKNITLFIYLLYIILTPVLYAMQINVFSKLAYGAMLFIIITLHYYWALVSIKTIKEGHHKALYLKRYKILFSASGFFLGSAISLNIFHYFEPSALVDRFAGITGALFCLSFVCTLFLAAKALAYSEKEVFNKRTNVFGTFLLYVYLPIGIFFISTRLKKLKQLS